MDKGPEHTHPTHAQAEGESERSGLARELAQKILFGELDPYAGAMRIWKEVIDPMDCFRCPDDLWPFKSNASTLKDIAWNSEQGGGRPDAPIRRCEQEILAAARALVDQDEMTGAAG